jgi:hypothetical protein
VNTSRNGLLVVLCLACIASVSSSEEQRTETRSPTKVEEDLDLSLLQRPKRAESVVDVFAMKAAALAPIAQPEPMVAAEPPPVPPKPEPPALPFRYVGKFTEGGTVRLLLSKGDSDYNIAGGETLDNLYRIDSLSEEAVVFTYLPLAVQQTLTLEAKP